MQYIVVTGDVADVLVSIERPNKRFDALCKLLLKSDWEHVPQRPRVVSEPPLHVVQKDPWQFKDPWQVSVSARQAAATNRRAKCRDDMAEVESKRRRRVRAAKVLQRYFRKVSCSGNWLQLPGILSAPPLSEGGRRTGCVSGSCFAS